MCYPCTNCGACGKFDENSPLYQPQPDILCLVCGGIVDSSSGICRSCGAVAFTPPGTKSVTP